MASFDWTKDVYDATATSDCWWYTPYDKGPDPCYWEHIARDNEMREIVVMELALGEVPTWARTVGIDYLPPCGHYTFPAPLLQVLNLIGAAGQQTVAGAFKIQCYTADRKRKRTAQDVCLCLDAWLAGSGPDAPAAELQALGYRKIDWSAACTALWVTLGERSAKKALLVKRLLLALRHAVKAHYWADDHADTFGRDTYLGDIRHYSSGTGFDICASPHVQAIDRHLGELDPDWRSLLKVDLGHWWLCAPNAFRLLEYDLWAIGHDRQAQPGDSVSKFLSSDDTCPNRTTAAAWWPDFIAALDGWWQAHPTSGPVADDMKRRLGEATPIKRWLVRLFLHKLRILASWDSEGLSKMVGKQG